MIYISFDIGIKNLALCILKKNGDQYTYIRLANNIISG